MTIRSCGIHCCALILWLFTVQIVGADNPTSETTALEKIELLGGYVERDEADPDRPVISIRFPFEPRFNGKYLHVVTSFRKLRSLDLVGVALSETDLNQLAELPDLEELFLYRPEITDAEVKQLQELKSLKSLILWEATNDEARLADVRKALPGVRVTRPGFRAIGTGQSRGRKIIAKTDRNRLSISSTVSQGCFIQVPGAMIHLESEKLVINELPEVDIPMAATNIEILDRRGLVTVLVDGKQLTQARCDAPPKNDSDATRD